MQHGPAVDDAESLLAGDWDNTVGSTAGSTEEETEVLVVRNDSSTTNGNC